MTYDDFLHFLCAVAVALFIIMVGFVITSDLFKPKNRCKSCKNCLNDKCRIVDWLSIDELDQNGNCGFYKEKGE